MGQLPNQPNHQIFNLPLPIGDQRGRGAGGRGRKILEFPSNQGFQAPKFIYARILNVYFDSAGGRASQTLLRR